MDCMVAHIQTDKGMQVHFVQLDTMELLTIPSHTRCSVVVKLSEQTECFTQLLSGTITLIMPLQSLQLVCNHSVVKTTNLFVLVVSTLEPS